MTTRHSPVRPSINSRFVLTLRKDSLIISRPFSTTTIGFSSISETLFRLPNLFFSPIASGSSPTNGISECSKSLRERTLLSNKTFRYIAAKGKAKPNINAIANILAFLGKVALGEPLGIEITRVLLAVNACVSSFSSRFCNR